MGAFHELGVNQKRARNHTQPELMSFMLEEANLIDLKQ